MITYCPDCIDEPHLCLKCFNTVHRSMQNLFSFLFYRCSNKNVQLFNGSFTFYFKVSSIYRLYSKCPDCQFSYNFYNSNKFKRSVHQRPPWRHRRNRCPSYDQRGSQSINGLWIFLYLWENECMVYIYGIHIISEDT